MINLKTENNSEQKTAGQTARKNEVYINVNGMGEVYGIMTEVDCESVYLTDACIVGTGGYQHMGLRIRRSDISEFQSQTDITDECVEMTSQEIEEILFLHETKSIELKPLCLQKLREEYTRRVVQDKNILSKILSNNSLSDKLNIEINQDATIKIDIPRDAVNPIESSSASSSSSSVEVVVKSSKKKRRGSKSEVVKTNKKSSEEQSIPTPPKSSDNLNNKEINKLMVSLSVGKEENSPKRDSSSDENEIQKQKETVKDKEIQTEKEKLMLELNKLENEYSETMEIINNWSGGPSKDKNGNSMIDVVYAKKRLELQINEISLKLAGKPVPPELSEKINREILRKDGKLVDSAEEQQHLQKTKSVEENSSTNSSDKSAEAVKLHGTGRKRERQRQGRGQNHERRGKANSRPEIQYQNNNYLSKKSPESSADSIRLKNLNLHEAPLLHGKQVSSVVAKEHSSSPTPALKATSKTERKISLGGYAFLNKKHLQLSHTDASSPHNPTPAATLSHDISSTNALADPLLDHSKDSFNRSDDRKSASRPKDVSSDLLIAQLEKKFLSGLQKSTQSSSSSTSSGENVTEDKSTCNSNNV